MASEAGSLDLTLAGLDSISALGLVALDPVVAAALDGGVGGSRDAAAQSHGAGRRGGGGDGKEEDGGFGELHLDRGGSGVFVCE